MPSTSGTGAATTVRFGNPLYTAAVSSTNISGTATTSSSSLSSLSNTSSSNMARPIMALVRNGSQPVAQAPNLQPRADLQQMVANSTYLTSKNIEVVGQGGLVVLRGTAVSEYERQLVQAMVQLKPGVTDIQNEITIAPAPAGTTPGTK
jgi:osmotically-inducible protein OsmY